jgi:ABC-2 type transport system permease protein
MVGVLIMSEEYSTGMIRLTLAAMPRRTTVLLAKAMILASLVLPAAIIAIGASLFAGGLTLPGNGIGPTRGYPALSLADPPVLRAAIGSVLYLVLIALLGFGVATIVRDSAAAIGIVLALLYLFPVAAAVAGNPGVVRHIQQIGPMTAGLAIQATTDLGALPIGPWSGLGVLAAWATAALVTGRIVLRRRDA